MGEYSVNEVTRLINAINGLSHSENIYFGQGGIGDFVLLLSTFYMEDKNAKVIFAANSKDTIAEFAREFPLIKELVILDGPLHTQEVWTFLSNHPMVKGTGVTPKHFDYLGDWIECGKSNVFDYYGVKKNVNWFPRHTNAQPTITVQPFGGKDAFRVSAMPREFIEKLINSNPDHKIILIGSPEDREKLGCFKGAVWTTSFKTSIHEMLGCDKHYSVNSWTKSFTGVMGIPTVIYPSKYRADPQMAYGHPVDPANYVFLEGYGFEFILLDGEK